MFFEKFIENRTRLGLSKEDIANTLEIDLETVNGWESGLSMPDLDNLIKLSNVFGVSIDYLLKDRTKETGFSYYTIVKEKEYPVSKGKTIALVIYVLSVLGLFTLLILAIMEPFTYADSVSGNTYTGIKAYCHAYSEFCIAYYACIIGFILSGIYLFVPDQIIYQFFRKKN